MGAMPRSHLTPTPGTDPGPGASPDSSSGSGPSSDPSPDSRACVLPHARRPPRVHVVAMASHETPGLTNLRTSARLAGLGSGPGSRLGQEGEEEHRQDSRSGGGGVGDGGSGVLRGHTFTVVGLGEPYNDYADKIAALHAHLHATTRTDTHTDPASAFNDPTVDPSSSFSSSSSSFSSSSFSSSVPTSAPAPAYLHPDDDVVVIVDAYDVLLLPAVRMAPEFLASSSAPLVFCAENGGYPEFAFASLYQVRGC